MLTNRRNHTWRMFGILSGAIGVALVLSAWAWQGPSQTHVKEETSNNPVTVSVAEDSLVLSTTELDSGAVAFEVTNEGTTPHSFAIAGPAEESLDGEVAAGETETLEANLMRGTYTAYCPIEGHSDEESVEFTVGGG